MKRERTRLVCNLFAKLLRDTNADQPEVDLRRIEACLKAALDQEPAPCPEGERLFRARVLQGIPAQLNGEERLSVLEELLARVSATLAPA